MLKPRMGFFLGIIFLFGFSQAGFAQAPGGSGYVSGEILVKFKPGVPDQSIRDFNSRLKVVQSHESPSTGAHHLRLPPNLSVESAVSMYRGNPDVEYAEPNYTRRAFAVAIDPLFGNQWGLRNTGQELTGTFPALSGYAHSDIDANDAWEIVKNAPNLIVAVIDSGVDYKHPDLTDEDLNDNGHLDPSEDSNNNGVLDAGEDLNNNGILDPGEDVNGNGILDPSEDVNGNGLLDPAEDLNGNGLIDTGNIWVNPGEDINGNGVADASDYNSVDDDGDGFVDDLQGWNFVGNQSCSLDQQGQCQCTPDDPVGNNDPMDDFGHGTASAGVIAAGGNNRIGVAGILWKAKILPVKFLGAEGCGSVGDEVQSIQYAIQKGARIIVVNAGSTQFSQSEFDAIQAAQAAGIVFVAPAGNSQSNDDNVPVYPAGYALSNVISVAATDLNDHLAYFSNYGKKSVDVAAPGDCIYTTMPSGTFSLQLETNIQCTNQKFSAEYDYNSGTSMAASFVAGMAGLLLAHNPNLTPEQVRTLLITTSDANTSLKGRVVSNGRVNAYRALTQDTGAGLSGGRDRQAGCGGIGGEGGDPFPPGPAAATLLTIFLPLLLSSRRFRRGLRVFRGAVFFFVILAGISVQPLLSSVALARDQDPLNMDNRLSVKAGVQRYRSSEFFVTNSDYIAPSDLTSPVLELEYEYMWFAPSSVAFTLGHTNSGYTDLKSVCCSQMAMKNSYARMTIKFNIRPVGLKPLQFFIGPGIGYDRANLKVKSQGVTNSASRDVFDLHLAAGARFPLGPRMSVSLEGEYISAKIKDVNDFNDDLNFGGVTVLLGWSWSFPDFKHIIPLPAAAPTESAAPVEPVSPEEESTPAQGTAPESPSNQTPAGESPSGETPKEAVPPGGQPSTETPSQHTPPADNPSVAPHTQEPPVATPPGEKSPE